MEFLTHTSKGIIKWSSNIIEGVGKLAKTTNKINDSAKNVDNLVDGVDNLVKSTVKSSDDTAGVVKSTVKKDYQEIVQKAANDADTTVRNDITRNDASPTVQGTYKHTEFKNNLENLGDSNLKMEVSFDEHGNIVEYGKKGSVRLDAYQTNDQGKIVKVWDLKTGKADLSDARKREILKRLQEGKLVDNNFSINDITSARPKNS